MYTIDDRKKMAAIVQKALLDSEFVGFADLVTPDSFSADDSRQIVWWETEDGAPNGRDIFPKVFASLAISRKRDTRQDYHFKSLVHAREIAATSRIQLSSLKSLGYNDHAEYSEFFKRQGYFRPLENTRLDVSQRTRFVLCMSKNSREARFWKEYAKDETGACSALRIEAIEDPNIYNVYEFRDVAYDDGYRFDFINDIRYQFLDEFGKELFIEGITKFAMFYKRKKYAWEDETRLAFNLEQYPDLAKTFPISESRNAAGKIVREYITVPFRNDFFRLTIEEIILGKKVSDGDLADISQLGDASGFRVWRRK